MEVALGAQSGSLPIRLVVVDPAEIDDDLVCDITELLTSLCARLYGRRSAANMAQRTIEAVVMNAILRTKDQAQKVHHHEWPHYLSTQKQRHRLYRKSERESFFELAGGSDRAEPRRVVERTADTSPPEMI